jgi:glycosyltransferase involved in cell wall biosynthesis
MVARGLNPNGAEVVPNGVDVERYTVGSAEDRARAPTVLFLGRLKRYKRVDLLIDAIALLAERGLRVELRVGGQGEESDRLAAHARSRGVADRVSVLGYIPEEDKVSELRGAWIHGLTSVKEGWGISNLEAAACGTPSVASDAPGLRESVVHEETGLLVPHEDVGALADAIQRLVVDGQLRASMGNAARAFAERYSWDAAARSMERVLTRVVEASRPG